MIFVLDPVCKNIINWDDAQEILIPNGEHYYFCGRDCQEEFLKRPELHLVSDPGRDDDNGNGRENYPGGYL